VPLPPPAAVVTAVNTAALAPAESVLARAAAAAAVAAVAAVVTAVYESALALAAESVLARVAAAAAAAAAVDLALAVESVLARVAAAAAAAAVGLALVAAVVVAVVCYEQVKLNEGWPLCAARSEPQARQPLPHGQAHQKCGQSRWWLLCVCV